MTFPTGWDGPGYFAAQLAPEPVRTDWAAPAARTGIVPPRPLQFGDILSGAFQAVRFAPLTMFGLTLVTLMIAQLVGLGLGFVLGQQFGASFVPFDDPDLGSATLFSWSTLTGTLVNSLTGIVVGMGLMYTVFEAVSGRRVTPREALRHMVSRLPPALGFSALTGLAVAAVVALAVVALAPLFSLGDGPSGPALLAVLAVVVGALALGAWLSTRLLMAPCAIAIERLGPLRAIARSWALSRGVFWRLFGIYWLTSLIIAIAASTVSSVFSFAGMLFALQDAGTAMIVVTTASTLASTVLTLPLTSAVTTLLYVDARIRREGYDLQLSEALYG